MTDIITEKLSAIRTHGGTVLNLGVGREDTLGEYFQSKHYKTLDFNPDSGADIIGDAHAIPLADQSVDSILAFSLLEHTHSPYKVADEIYRVLKPGGMLLLSTPFIHPYHAGRCPDYYRFSQDGLRYLFKKFSSLEVKSDGGFFLALSFFIPPQLQFASGILTPILKFLDRMFTQHRSSAHDVILFAKK